MADQTPDPAEVIARTLACELEMMTGGDPEPSDVHDARRVLDALAAAGLRVVPDDRPATGATAVDECRMVDDLRAEVEVLTAERDEAREAFEVHRLGCRCPVPDNDTRREGFLALNRENRVEVLAEAICADVEMMDWQAESSETLADRLASEVADLIEVSTDEALAAYLGRIER